MTNFRLYLIKTVVAIFPNVCLGRRSYAQNWEVLTLKNCYRIEPLSYVSTAYVVASYGPRFLSTLRFVKIWATCDNFLGKWFTAPPGKKFPVRLCLEINLVALRWILSNLSIFLAVCGDQITVQSRLQLGSYQGTIYSVLGVATAFRPLQVLLSSFNKTKNLVCCIRCFINMSIPGQFVTSD